MTFSLSSPAFKPNGPIPFKHSVDGDNLSPALEWRDAPKGAKSFLLVVDDPDAPMGNFQHWGLYNIAGGSNHLSEGAGSDGKAGNMAVNDFGNARYDGPQPPKGHGIHHYHFKLAALDVERLSPAPKAKVKDLWTVAKGHIVAQTEIVGTFER